MAKLLSTIIDGFLSSKKFVSGFLGEGWRLGKRGRRYTLEVDDVVVRHTMTVFELLISKIRAVKGALGISQGCGKVKEVREEEDVYVLTLEEENTFRANDLIRCQSFGQNSRAYWVKISSVKDAEVVIAKSEFSEDDSIPEAGDELVQFGNTTDTARQSAIYLSADENGVPAIDVLQGIHGKSFEGCTKVRVGGLDGVVDPDFPEGIGDFGIYCENGYFKGTIAGGGGYMLRSDGTGYICNGAIWWDKQKKVHFDGEVVLGWENLPADAKDLLKGDKGDPGDPGEDANLLPWIEEWDRNKTQIGSDYLISPKIFAGGNGGTADAPVLTGVAIGKDVCTIDGKKKSGIFGLNKGKTTFSIDALTGNTFFGGEINVKDNFIVNTEGKLVAKDAVLTGAITATSGAISIFKINDDNISYVNFMDGVDTILEMGSRGLTIDMIPIGDNKHVITSRLHGNVKSHYQSAIRGEAEHNWYMSDSDGYRNSDAGSFSGRLMVGCLVMDPQNIMEITKGNSFVHGGRLPSVVIANYQVDTKVILPDVGLRNGQILSWINNTNYDSLLYQADGTTKIVSLTSAKQAAILMFYKKLWYLLAKC